MNLAVVILMAHPASNVLTVSAVCFSVLFLLRFFVWLVFFVLLLLLLFRWGVAFNLVLSDFFTKLPFVYFCISHP